MAIRTLDEDLSIIQKLDDEPNDVGGLSAAELKARFDAAGLAIQSYINETLIPDIKADNLPFTQSAAVPAGTVQGAIENVQAQIAEVVVGKIPDAGKELHDHIADIVPVCGKHRKERAEVQQHVEEEVVLTRGEGEQVLQYGKVAGARYGQKLRHALHDAE